MIKLYLCMVLFSMWGMSIYTASGEAQAITVEGISEEDMRAQFAGFEKEFENKSQLELSRSLNSSVARSDVIRTKFLLERKKIDPNDVHVAREPLLFKCRNKEIAELLLQHGADPHARYSGDGGTVLHRIATGPLCEDSCDLASLYIAKEVPVDAKSRWGETALVTLAVQQIFRTVGGEALQTAKKLAEIFLLAGADPQSRNTGDGWSTGMSTPEIIRTAVDDEKTELSIELLALADHIEQFQLPHSESAMEIA